MWGENSGRNLAWGNQLERAICGGNVGEIARNGPPEDTIDAEAKLPWVGHLRGEMNKLPEARHQRWEKHGELAWVGYLRMIKNIGKISRSGPFDMKKDMGNYLGYNLMRMPKI